MAGWIAYIGLVKSSNETVIADVKTQTGSQLIVDAHNAEIKAKDERIKALEDALRETSNDFLMCKRAMKIGRGHIAQNAIFKISRALLSTSKDTQGEDA